MIIYLSWLLKVMALRAPGTRIIRFSNQKVEFEESSFERKFMTAGRAVTEFLLKPSQLEGLPKTIRRSAYESGVSMTVYNRKDVEERAFEIWGSPEKLEEELKKQEQVKKIYEQYVYETKRILREARRSAENTLVREKVKKYRMERITVFLAIFIDMLNFAFKLTIWVYTNSNAMLAEAVHSAADTLNQSILIIGLIQSGQKATIRHPYGYTNMMYLSSVISAVGILCIGAGTTIYVGVDALIYSEHHTIIFDEIRWAFVVLAFSFITESVTLWYSLYVTIKSARRHRVKFFSYILEGVDPGTSVVFLEDVVSALGSIIAAGMLGLSWYQKSIVPDKVGAIVIGLLLAIVAIFLIVINGAALVGRSIPKEKLNHINERIEADVMIRAVHDVKGIDMGNNLVRYKAEIDFDGAQLTHLYLDRMDLKDLLDEVQDIKGIDDLEAFMLKHGEAIVDLLGGEIDRIELKIRNEFPEVRHMDLELL